MNHCTSVQRHVALIAVLIAAVTCTTLPGQEARPPAQAVPPKAAEAQRLIAVLRSGAATTFDKARACQQLAVLGNPEAVPPLAALLADEKLAAYARCSLESIADPSAGDAVRAALPNLHGTLLAGAVNSIGVRRDAKAVDALGKLALDGASGVAGEALAALGRIATPAAAEILRRALRADPAPTRAAAADACLVCAEQQLARDQRAEAAALYDAVRQAGVPNAYRAAATHGAILAGGPAALPLLVEQLKGDDAGMFAAALAASRRMPGDKATRALLAQLDRLPPARQVPLIAALADRRDAAVLPAMKRAAASGPAEVRLAAIRALGQLADASSAPLLLEALAAPEPALAQTAQASLISLRGNGVDAAIVARLGGGSPKIRVALLELAGQRKIAAAAAAVQAAADDPAAEVRSAAIRALGRIIAAEDLPRLVGRLPAAKSPQEAGIVKEALGTACARIADREACAAKLAGCMPQAPLDVQCFLLELMGRVGGRRALEIVAAHARSPNADLQDAATRALGQWPSAEAAAELLTLAKTLSVEKLQVRALRGYIRLARQADLPPDRRGAMCEEALRTARRDEEKALALQVLVRIPSAKTLSLAASYLAQGSLKQDAAAAAVAIAEKLVQAEPREVARTMQQVLQAGVGGQPAARARELLERTTPAPSTTKASPLGPAPKP
jgi:HEAT repeat protein